MVVAREEEIHQINNWVKALFSEGPLPARVFVECRKQGWGKLQKCNSIDGGPLRLNGQEFKTGLGTHTYSEIVIKLNTPAMRFQALAGIDDNAVTRMKKSRMIFSVEANGEEIWRSKEQKVSDAPAMVDVELGGCSEFVLKAWEVHDDLQYAHADWVDLKVTTQDGRVLPIEETKKDELLPNPPLSFCYGGKEFLTLLSSWQRRVEPQIEENDFTVYRQTYHDPVTGLECYLELKTYRDFPAVEWVWKIKNTGSSDTPILDNIQGADLKWLTDSSPVLHHSQGSTCKKEDFFYSAEPLAEGTTRLSSIGGRSSDGCLPFFNIELQDQGTILAIGWTGQWAANFHYVGNKIAIKAGMESTHFKLHPGEEIRTPRILMIFWQGEPLRGNNLLRQFILKHHTRRLNGDTIPTPICFGSWGGMKSPDHLARINLIQKEKLDYDYYWIDAGWYGPADSYSPDEFKGDWAKHVGNWNVNPVAHPNGLKPISDAVHKADMKFLLWLEPERAICGTPLAKEHPEWFLEAEEGNGNLLFNLGLPEARVWLTNFISGILKDNNIDCYRQDFNFEPLPYWRENDEPDRQGMSEIRHIEGLYAFWDELLRRHPGLLIDNCASGGRRIDLETIGRSIPLWRSDIQCFPNFDSIAGQIHTYGLAHWVPCSTTGSQHHPGDTYNFRSVMCTGLMFHLCMYEHTPIDPKYPYDWHRRMIADLRRAIPCYLGDFYPLTPCAMSKNDWMVYQMHRPDLDEGIIVAFRREMNPFVVGDIRLRGLDETHTYQLEDADSKTIVTEKGEILLKQGYRITMDKCRDSRLIFYKKKH
jgi:alpha-galactosidase